MKTTGDGLLVEFPSVVADDIFAVQEEIARSIVEALELTLSAHQRQVLEKVPTADVRAYDYYLRGRQFFHDWRGGLRPALEMFSKAIEIDPGYAHAHAGLADTYAMLHLWLDPDEGQLERAEEASRIPGRLFGRPGVPLSEQEGLSRRGEPACREARRAASEAESQDARAFMLGAGALWECGDHARAMEWSNLALSLRPDDSSITYGLACFHARAGNVEKAVGFLERAVKVGALSKEWLEHDSDLDPIREDPRFRALLEKL